MPLRIQRGEWAGRRLASPDDDAIRPMSARLRCKVIDALHAALPGSRVHDLCCGTGALGLEALSVGASRATFVDRSRRALTLARRNLEALGAMDRATLVRMPAQRALEDLALEGGGAGPLILFVAPPYDLAPALCELAIRALPALLASGEPRALVLQHPPPFTPPDAPPELERRAYRAAYSVATILRRGM